VSLHGVWDTYLVNEAMRDAEDLTVYAGALNARISPEQAAAWSAGTATDWAMALAVSVVDSRLGVGGSGDLPTSHASMSSTYAKTDPLVLCR